ncbi:tetratricopeptide repeat containing protein [Entamoeba histolytica HM-1:IMSS-B]|uniref:RNA polymerase II-associated protein 3 n=6 Tax=Entamoeba histolytica TaxID=5759 RepID=C4LXR3_ENTH1|nr:uncharacterized protein EHI_014270 [Entamoeba histolytica HM-1:IMSS]EMD46915.1 tetratricopeptide repeatcontaining protein [Entamoeba histolytica KU27]EMH75609.1 tetratricopeptide repeat containing protein [Entamoeba histolytica HM-1:IMSS-B]EMS17335.1 tetratricopeptide repeat-containing protein [Entamoeba histolytica HM-3:IMSS]ENY61977.1 tetratricopeptide repeat-containing protein [Entamoeba histolytica HM-1:IMSS-A]GAT93557.1 hypothetical protein conserved domain containing [Entamoeba histol|eukprot:XP_655046.1 uncharacterized protein EHI_014270 [Entamoeba histolytica HM-1:IMSS]
MGCKGEEYKLKGNEFLQQKRYKEAKEQYTMAIKENPRESIYYGNRSLVEIKLEEYEEAQKDIDLALQCNPLYVKALLRRALISMHFKKYFEAKKDYLYVLELEKGNKEATNALVTIETLINKEDKLTKDVQEIKTSIKCPKEIPSNFDCFERNWKDLNEEERNKYLNYIGIDKFKILASENITSEMINQIAHIKKDDIQWSKCICSFKRISFLKLFVNEEAKKWLNN